MPHEFASVEWMEALRSELTLALADLPADVGFSFGERYIVGEDRSRGWHIRRFEGTSTFVAAPTENADVELVIDFDVARQLCAPMTPELARLEREAVRDGRICWRGDATKLPRALSNVHERMVTLTSRG